MPKRKNVWKQQGAKGPKENPGSYFKYTYERARHEGPYTTTDPATGKKIKVKQLPQHALISDIGKKMSDCEGKEGTEFRICRSAVIAGVMKAHGYTKTEGRYQKAGAPAKTAVKAPKK